MIPEPYTEFLDRLAEQSLRRDPVDDDETTDHGAEAAAYLATLDEIIESEGPPTDKQQTKARHAFADHVVSTAQAHALIAVAEHLKTLSEAWTAFGMAVVGALPDLATVVGALRPPDEAPRNAERLGAHSRRVFETRRQAAAAHGALTDAEQVELDADGMRLFQRGWRAGQAAGLAIAEEKLDKIKNLAEAAMVYSPSSTLGSILYFIDGRTAADADATPDEDESAKVER